MKFIDNNAIYDDVGKSWYALISTSLSWPVEI